jgi:hypothetical protein
MGIRGNVFHTKDIEAAIEKGRNKPQPRCTSQYDVFQINGNIPSMGQLSVQYHGNAMSRRNCTDTVVQILHAEEYRRPDYNEMLSTVWINFSV